MKGFLSIGIFSILLNLGFADPDYSKVVCTSGIHKVYVTNGGGIEFVHKRKGSASCQINFIFPKGSGFKVECPEMNLKNSCQDEYLSFKETSKLGYVGGTCGDKPDYTFMKRGQEGVRYTLQAKYMKKSKKADGGFRCMVKAVPPVVLDDSLCTFDIGHPGCFHLASSPDMYSDAANYCNNYFPIAGGTLYRVGEDHARDLAVHSYVQDEGFLMWVRNTGDDCVNMPHTDGPEGGLFEEGGCSSFFTALCMRNDLY